MPIPTPNPNEDKKDFVQRCMSDDKMVSEYEGIDQRLAVCSQSYEENLAQEKVSFDFDDTLNTQKGLDLALEWKNKGADVYVISARNTKEDMLPRANKAGILFSRVYATGSNEAKIQKVKDLGITIHYDNNTDVIKELGEVGRLI